MQIRINYHYINDNNQIDQALTYLGRQSILGLDIETNSLDPFNGKILSIQLGNEETQYIFHIGSLTKLEPIFDILRDQNIKKVGQNLKFDYKFLKYHYNVLFENIRDTFVVEHLLTKGQRDRGYDLATIANQYLNSYPDMDKTIRKKFENYNQKTPFTQQDCLYAATDVAVLIPIYREQHKLVYEYGMQDTAAMECECIMATGDMELNGILLDQNEWLKLEKRAIDELQIVENDLDNLLKPVFHSMALEEKTLMFGKKAKNLNQLALDLESDIDINYASIQQTKPILEKHLGVILPNTEEKILKKYSYDLTVQTLLKFRELSKRISTYGRSFFEHIHPVTGRIHSDFDQTRAKSGRYGSKNPK